MEYTASSLHRKVEDSPIYSQHIENIENEILNGNLIPSDKIPILNALKILYLDNISGAFKPQSLKEEHRFLITNICKFIDEKIEGLKKLQVQVFAQSFEEYRKMYPEKLLLFLRDNPDADESYFIHQEKEEYQSRITLYEKYKGIEGDTPILIEGQTHKSRYFTALKVVPFLILSIELRNQIC